MPKNKPPRRRYKPRFSVQKVENVTTPKCPVCKKPTAVGRTSPGGIYFRCEGDCPEFFVQLEEAAQMMRARYNDDLSGMAWAQKAEYAKGARTAQWWNKVR